MKEGGSRELGAVHEMHEKRGGVAHTYEPYAIRHTGHTIPLYHYTLTFVVKAINSINRSTLMVAAENEEVLGKLDLVR